MEVKRVGEHTELRLSFGKTTVFWVSPLTAVVELDKTSRSVVIGLNED